MVNKQFLILMGCVGVLWGCSALPEGAETTAEGTLSLPELSLSAATTTVKTLKQDQPQAGKSIFLEGQVQRRVPLLEGWLYELEDATGSIWVLTQDSDPVVGNIARVEGVLQYEQILIDGIDMGEYYLQERAYQPVTTSDE